jgi:CheY-like chemotaxis protein
MDSTVLRVLLAEDNPNDVSAFRNALEKRDDRAMFKLEFARDGLEALDYLNHRGEFAYAKRPDLCLTRPDLVVLNINMPGMDGWGVLGHMKGDPRFRAIPVVIWTIAEIEVYDARAYNWGACGIFTKPVDPVDVEAQVNAILTYFRWARLSPHAPI